MARHKKLPQFHALMNPTIKAIQELGGSGSIGEITTKVLNMMDLPEEVLNIPHNPEENSRTEIEYRLAWARTYLKKFGIVDNSERGVWVIVPEKRNINEVDPKKVIEFFRSKQKKIISDHGLEIEGSDESPANGDEWRNELHNVLTRELTPDGFERLIKRMLRESGFVQVEVTGKSGDGGIDGKGIVKIGNILSFHVLFQCKRYKDSVGPAAIRDFRGALVGRADKGLFVTTGSFTPAAKQEATRDGATPIDLLDGEDLASKLRELRLGIDTELVESVSIDSKWFKDI